MIFLSYSRNDGISFVTDLEKRLQAHQKLTWRDVRDLHPDQDFTGDIEEAIENSSHIVVCITPDTKRKNSFVRREIQYALALKKPVIPYLCQADVTPHISIINNEWVKYFADPQAAFERLMAIIDGDVYENRQIDAPQDPFRSYLTSALKFIAEGLRQRIIAPIDLKVGDAPSMVRPPEHKRSVFELALSGVELSEERQERRKFATFREGFEVYGQRALLLGEPGAGKTVTLMAYARDAYAARLDDPTLPLPLFNLVPMWDGRPLDEWIAEAHGLNVHEVRREMEAGRVLLLLDGLDELGQGDEQTDPRLQFLQMLPRNNYILLTSRTQEYSEISHKATLNGAITLRSLDDNQMRDYLRAQPELLALLESDEELRQVTRTPLLMSLFAFAYQDLPESERQQLIELNNAHELREKIFMRYIDQRYQHERTKVGADLPFTLGEVKAILARLAMENATGDFYRDNQGKLYTPRENVLMSADFKRAVPDDFNGNFSEMMVRLNLLARNEDDTYRFIHLLLRDTLAHHLLVKALNSPYKASRRHAADALGRVGDARVVVPLMELLRDPDQQVRSRVADALVMIGQPTVEPLMNAMSDASPYARSHAANALGRIGDIRAIDLLVAALSDSNGDVRRQSVSALGQFDDNRAIQAVVNALGDSDVYVRQIAARLVRNFGKAAVGTVVGVLNSPNLSLRQQAIEILGQIKSALALESLMDMMSDPNADIRRRAIDAVGLIDDARAVEALAAALNDTNWDVCLSAARALDDLRTPEAHQAVEKWRATQRRR